MLRTFSILLIFQSIGEGIVHLFGWPVPGPVIGMLMLFLCLLARKGMAEKLLPDVQALLRHLSLLFIPAGVGIMVHGQRVLNEWLPLLLALLVSTALSIVVTALCAKYLQK